MAKQLIGRVSWEQDWNGTNFYIPSKKDWKLAFIAVWLVLWSIGGFHAISQILAEYRQGSTINFFLLVWSVGWLFGLVFAVKTLLWGAGGKDTLYLMPSELKVSYSLFGLPFRERTISLDDIRNLRFVPEHRFGRNYKASRISFECSKGTVSFGEDLNDGEALAIIEEMLKIYPFPKKDRALEYVDLG